VEILSNKNKRKYRITVQSLSGKILTFHVSEYKIEDGFVVFIDERNSQEKRFHGSRCEFEPIGGDSYGN